MNILMPRFAVGLCRFAPAALVTITACLLQISSATAATAAPGWTVGSISLPTNLTPGDSSGRDVYRLTAINVGGAPTNGSPVTLTDTLPAGVTPDPGGATGTDTAPAPANKITCTATGQTVTCVDPDTTAIPAGGTISVTIPVDVAAAAPSSVTNNVSVAGGGAASGASATEPTTVSASRAAFAAESFDGSVSNVDGSADTQAGSVPYEVTTSFALSSELNSSGAVVEGANAKDIQVDVPPGLVGDPLATPRCTQAQFNTQSCPAASQVGTIALLLAATPTIHVQQAVYNIVPPAGIPAQFGFNLLSAGVYLDGSVRTGSDYGLTITVHNAPQSSPIIAQWLTLWGVPADHNGSGAARTPFLTLPTSCQGPQTTTMRTDSWQDPGNFKTASFVSHDNFGNPVGATGCEELDFTPTITIQPDTTVADAPSGLQVDLRVPQNDNPAGTAEANLKDTTVTLPTGMSVNPSAANGLAACSPAQIGIDNANEPTCPDASKIGSVEVDTPLLPDPLTGGIYLAQQNNNPFDSLLAIYVTAEADGALVKLAGQVVADPLTGQLTTTFDDNPQLPFNDFRLDFFGGAQAALATPESCGTFTTASSLSPWSGTGPVASSDPFTLNSGCVNGFSPAFTAGTQNAQAGAYAPFVLSLQRSDTDQNFSGLSVKLPPGMLAKLAGVQQCSDAQLASISTAEGTGAAQLVNPSCPAGSQVGTVTTGVGVGPDPFSLSGKAYLTGPYRGAPYGLAIVVPAVAGPFDLGTVVVRQALFIDPTTAQVTDVSDPFPTILDGIPLDIRRIDVDLNRPDFTVNPTSCNPMSVTGTATSTQGATSNLSSRFQVGGCQDIGFSPKLKIALTGKGKTTSGDHPTLTATLIDPAGQANIQSAKVALPLSIALDPNNSNNVCAFATAQAVHGGPVGCPTSTIVGTATAVTPLLSQPLTGNVYLVQGIRTNKQGQKIKTLPSLLVPLRGQIALDLRAQTSVSGGKLVTTFPTIPDAPVSKFTLNINGGKKGLLVVTGRGLNICQKKQVGNANFGAQSGKTTSGNMTFSTPCGKAAKLRVVSKKMTADALTLKVQTSERGKLTVTGQQLAGFSKTLAAGVHQIRVHVKPASARGSRAKHATSMKVTVKLAPANAMPATKRLSVRT